MSDLYLRNCKNVFIKKDKKRKYSVYHEPNMNNLIVFSPYDDCTIDSVCDSIGELAYAYLINLLNNQKDLVVLWSQVSGTTSDYTIYYGLPVDELKDKSYKEILYYIFDLDVESDVRNYKYTEVKDNVETKLFA